MTKIKHDQTKAPHKGQYILWYGASIVSILENVVLEWDLFITFTASNKMQ